VPQDCELEVATLLSQLLDRTGAEASESGDPRGDAAFDAEQSARAAVGAEAYYRAMIRGGPESWNLRDTHMADTLDRLLDHHRESGRAADPKAVVWEHNTHVGDARFTDMADAGMVNVGQLVRERYGEPECVLVGFVSYQGTVIAADERGRPTSATTAPSAWCSDRGRSAGGTTSPRSSEDGTTPFSGSTRRPP
jgi:erythromycin esterase